MLSTETKKHGENSVYKIALPRVMIRIKKHNCKFIFSSCYYFALLLCCSCSFILALLPLFPSTWVVNLFISLAVVADVVVNAMSCLPLPPSPAPLLLFSVSSCSGRTTREAVAAAIHRTRLQWHSSLSHSTAKIQTRMAATDTIQYLV